MIAATYPFIVIYAILMVWIFRFMFVFRHHLTCMAGMMSAMGLGMSMGLGVGTLMSVWFSDQFFQAIILSMIIGGIIGVLAGIPISVMAVLDGLLSGMMAGMMGTMFMAMIPSLYIEPALKIMAVLSSGTVFLVFLMLQGEIKTKYLKPRSFVLSKPQPMFIVVVVCFIIIHQFKY